MAENLSVGQRWSQWLQPPLHYIFDNLELLVWHSTLDLSSSWISNSVLVLETSENATSTGIDNITEAYIDSRPENQRTKT